MRILLTASLILLSFSVIAQQPDTANRLKEVEIRPYFSTQPLLRATGSIGLIDHSLLEKQAGGALVSAMNTVPGIRMEERSPGSYRLSIRGSLLRSPFGIRNVKIYFDEFPLTDAGGNSYLNALDVAALNRIQILKGPQGSLFGANSGGVVLIQSQTPSTDSTLAKLRLEAGSYGGFRQSLSAGKQFKNYSINITQAYQRSDGYRDHSAMDRKYFQVSQQLNYSKQNKLKAMIFYSDLHYNTPGGLNLQQYLDRPTASRPASGPIKSAIEQKAGIYSNTLFGGISNDWVINDHFKHIVSVFSSYTDFKNPFITNYEKRKELTLGMRSYLECQKKTSKLDYRFNIGFESTQTASDIFNYNNNLGQATELKTSDKLKAASNFAFIHLNIDFLNKWLLELSSSGNLYQYTYQRIAPVATGRQTNRFDFQLMPRIALSYLLSPELSLRTAISKGYSPPTIAEIRASDQVINVNLQPESGWNHEIGIRYQSPDHRFQIDLTGFYYRLQNAIVRRMDENENEYFINAGGTKQWGLENSISFWIVPVNPSKFIRGLQFYHALTLSNFKFDHYADNTADYSGNQLTGVPKQVLINSIDLQFPGKWSLFAQHNYTSSIPLNDANTAYAKKYHLVQARLSWKPLKSVHAPMEIFVGVDNLLNEKYSLGNDLNAVAGRYYNPAAGRNYNIGLSLQLRRK
ncbi:TonB-dependent receptor [Pedobacter gandavensis]|uniref:TonB-dependent receptor plug domain-containing protein n=1 Tax=Pedobacter gandavensis TaxID=2679963 RepID=A0ABR6EW29_9SPHI|nr:TonB-dependent receptor [Pedobacter gandavensis]MBB2149483.1 TonB-dependent receptor plug domain-containing protein [Pedobacter gandavensis]